MTANSVNQNDTIVFLHPDLGIGGAERLVVDAALALKRPPNSYSVRFVTNHHDKTHCFDETKDGTFDVTVVGSWLPRSIFGQCRALCAYIRMCYAALFVCLFTESRLIFVDQIAVCLPILRLFAVGRHLIFYCHFPDQLLTKRESVLKRAYRYPLDWFEEWTTGLAHCVIVNSKFTESVFRSTFPSLSRVPLLVLYPTFNSTALDSTRSEFSDAQILDDQLGTDVARKCIFVSLNRYERKKNLVLAIEAFAHLKSAQLVSASTFSSLHLVIAGGYDRNNPENVQHFVELTELVTANGLAIHSVTFLKSPSDCVKSALIRCARALLYTPSFEHFGIVPLEAMYLRTPVIAVASGGPLETVRHNETGYLCEQSSSSSLSQSFAQQMAKLSLDAPLAESIGEAARDWVISKFHFDAFAQQLAHICKGL